MEPVLMKPVTIIGMGMGLEDLTANHLKIIKKADILVGGRRLLNHFKDSSVEKKPIGKDIDHVINFVKKHMYRQRIVVLASGDPLFYGIGAKLVGALGAENVLIYPNISSVAAAFARIKEPWSDVRVISLHGKKNESLLFKALENENTVAVFTDPKKNPSWLAERLLAKDLLNVKLCVLEALGSVSERFGWYTLKQAANMEFSEPNMVVLKRRSMPQESRRKLHLGAQNNWYDHQAGLITKPEVRAITLSKLQLSSNHIVWDLGAGSGSVSIEASLFVKKGKIFTVEHDAKRIEHILTNKKRFGVKNLTAIQAVLPDGLKDLPRPDRIFIGGGGRKLKQIMLAACQYLKPTGIIVINTVLIPNVGMALNTLKRLEFKTEVVQIQINRSREMPWAERLEAQNPVWIITGMRIADIGLRTI
jgi:precorrin-6Y C5,15-methyltransferase (decarboxylating)